MKLISITRSFSYKKSLGNYQMADFFCSQTAECEEAEAEKISESLHNFCKNEVVKSLNRYVDMEKKQKLAEIDKSYKGEKDKKGNDPFSSKDEKDEFNKKEYKAQMGYKDKKEKY